MKLMKNKFFVIVIAIALVLCIVPTVLSVMGRHDLVRTALSAVATPFRVAFNWAADGISGFGKYFSGVDSLMDENEQLRAELEEYKQAAARAELAEGENAWLRAQLDFAASYSEYSMLDAKVTGRTGNSYSVIYTLNRGSESGVEHDMAVITPDGVAGYVKEVGLGWCRVVALTDPTSAVGVYTSEGVYGTAEGSVKYRNDNCCIMNSAATGLSVGSDLYSSGYGNIYPEGLAVGTIISSVKDKYSHMTTYIIEPTVDFDNLTSVMIVTGRTISTGTTENDNG